MAFHDKTIRIVQLAQNEIAYDSNQLWSRLEAKFLRPWLGLETHGLGLGLGLGGPGLGLKVWPWPWPRGLSS